MGLYPAVLQQIQNRLERTWNARSGRRRRQRSDAGYSNAPAMISTLEPRVMLTLPTVSISSMQNGTEGGQNGQLVLTRSSTTGTLTLNVSIGTASTATSGSDYTAIPATVTFANGSNTATININVINDTFDEPNESLVINISPGQLIGYGPGGRPINLGDNCTISGPASATIQILDNDNVAPSITPIQTQFNSAHDQTLAVTTPIVSGTDSDGDPITLQLVSDVAHGTLTLNADATFTYTPDAQYVGADAFQVRYVDSQGLASNTVTITLSLTNLSPTFANNQTAVSVDENTAVGTTILDASATDPDDPTLTYSILSGNGGGYFSIDANGQLKVASALNYEAMSQHQFNLLVEVMDSLGATVTRNVTVDVLNVNEPPVLLNFAFSTTDGVVYTFTGQVIDEAFGACFIVFDGLLDGHTSGCDLTGSFSYTVTLGGSTTGLIAAKAVDPLGQSSANSYVYI